jgi:Methyltransferase domain
VQEFKSLVAHFVVPLLKQQKWNRVCEIGACNGNTTDFLLDLGVNRITVIDPCLDNDLVAKYQGNSRVTVMQGTSLEVLPELRDKFDCMLMDGDHNWYTVYNELTIISKLNMVLPGGMIFFHDVGWPWGRRDMYYQPEVIPAEYRHQYDSRGIVPGHSELSENGVAREVQKATHEGGAYNGVLTAIEDFLREHENEYSFARVHRDYGLGIMCPRSTSYSELRFLKLKCRCFADNALFRSKSYAKIKFPSAWSIAKQLAGRSTA